MNINNEINENLIISNDELENQDKVDNNEEVIEEQQLDEIIEEEETEEEIIEEEQLEEENNQENNLKIKNAIDVLFDANLDDLHNLDESTKNKLVFLLKSFSLDEVTDQINWTVKTLLGINNLLQKTVDDNEEFRTTSKVTLQKNVQLLEDQVKGTQFNKLLKPIAQLYSNYVFMLDAPIDERKTLSNIEGILEEIECFLDDFGVTKIEAKIGDDFDPLNFKISKKIETNDISLDKKVACVKQPGWKKERFVLVPLRADMYVYNENIENNEGEEN